MHIQKWSPFALLMSIQAITGCTSSKDPYENEDGLHSTVHTHVVSQTIEGVSVDRYYTVQTPLDWDTSSPLPLLFAFHGGGGEGHFFVEDFDEIIEPQQCAEGREEDSNSIDLN